MEEDEVKWEHESSCTLNIKQIKEKMARYDRWKGWIIWTCDKLSWIDKLSRYATHDRHLFTTTELARQDFHAQIWVDRHGQTFSFGVQ